MPSTVQTEWLNQNALRAYPFAENSTRLPSDGSGGTMGEGYALPNYLVVDAILSLPYAEELPSLFVSSVSLAGGVATVVLSAHVDSTDTDSIVGSVSTEASGTNVAVPFAGSGDYEGATGAIVFGDLSRFDANYPDGIFAFDRSQTTLEARCVRPSARCVSGVLATDSDNAYSTRALSGVVSLIAGANVRLSYVSGSNAIRIDVDSNSGYNEECECDRSSKVRTINGISVSDVLIEGGDCISVETSNGRITISDTCAKPCCGCEELNFLNSKSNEIVTAITRLSALSESLQQRLSEFETAYLESERSPIKAL